MKFIHTIHIDANPDAVWSFLDDPKNLAELNPGLKSYRHVSGPERDVGAVYEFVHAVDSRELVTTTTITDRRPPRLMTTESTSETGATTMTFAFESVDGRTEWTMFVEYRFKGVYWWASLFTRRAMRNAQRTEMEAMAERIDEGLRA